MFCLHCGNRVSPEAIFCQVCGKQLKETPNAPPSYAQSIPAQSSTYTKYEPPDQPSITQYAPPIAFNSAVQSPALQNRLLQPKGIVSLIVLIAVVFGLIAWVRNVTSNGSGNILYSADWSGGMDGWSVGNQWSVNNGMLSSDGSGCCGGPESIITAPYQLNNVSNYIVEARVQFLGFDQVCNGYSFGVNARMIPESNGYEGGINLGHGLCDPSQASATLHVDNYTQLATTPFVPGTGWHTYDLEVNGDQLTLSIDGTQMVQATSDVHSEGGVAGIEDFNVQMNVSSFKITAV